MDILFGFDWHKMFVPTIALSEIIVRGSIMYLGLFVLIRFVLKRDAGSLGIADLLMVVLLGDATQNAMGSNYESITEGIVLIATLLFWNYLLDWISYNFPKTRRWIEPPPLLIVRNGKMLKRNMRREMITEEELMGELRKEGIEDIHQVKSMHMESDGHFSVVRV